MMKQKRLLFDGFGNELELVGLALALGARDVPGWSAAEEELARRALVPDDADVKTFRRAIRNGLDPLGDLFCSIRSAEERRPNGATFTPLSIVKTMVEWAANHSEPERVVDPGAGSGRFLLRSGKLLPNARLIGIEIDPLAASIARANIATSGFADRSEIVLGDYRSVSLPRIEGRTLFIGNPPYVRHHLIPPIWKKWLTTESAKHGIVASQLAGLHAHFFLATVAHSSTADFGVFITAAEWLDVNYGQLIRELFLGPLGGRRIVIVEPQAMPFPDAATTAAITYFDMSKRPKSIPLKRIDSISKLGETNGNHFVRRERLETERRWSHFTHVARDVPSDYLELGEICRVHRGQVTGANHIWIEGEHSKGLPEDVMFPTVTRAKELFSAGKALTDPSVLRRVIDLPHNLDVFENPWRRRVQQFLRRASALGADRGYVATNRKAWWSVGLREPAPILATYMARRPPAFVLNCADVRHINIAHGLYPRERFGDVVLKNLVDYLSRAVRMTDGRTYAGGLTKFEPREMERFLVPDPSILAQMCS